MIITRRRVAAAGALALLGGAALLRQKDHGAGGHSPYFAAMAAAVKRAGLTQPTLVIDRVRLRANIAAVTAALAPTPLGRVIVESLIENLNKTQAYKKTKNK